ncbi:MAG TPA: tetratricopeptide repeat protein [Candidatus Hydrogenedentes bacterium]|nr:tetratricopeptide repeat protein [Candidatus Hydrogenedentota bacterium]HOL76921.1 tetratricopeptide repeat protein [Candidatus Hydrogenedentota bacterium]HPO87291.1 tetratricopeptide repeat protein [Candidatus Hydrogenedentota bacterium]
MASTISVAMIIKNEAHNLRECLENIRGLADEICIVDTGSTDDSLAIAREFKVKTSVFIWCDDFSAARNESLRLCTKDWIFIFDADERIDPKDIQQIRALCSGPRNVCYWLPIRNYTNTTSVSEFTACTPNDPHARGFLGWYPTQRVRLFPNGLGARFEGKVHELIAPSLERLGIKTRECPVIVHHYPLLKPTEDHIKDKQELYLRLGHEKIKQDPTDAKAFAELGNQYAEVRDYEKAAAAYREALKRNPSDPENLKNLGAVLHLIGRNDEAKQALKLALEFDPTLADAYRNLGVVFAAEKEWQAALECFQEAMKFRPDWIEGHRFVAVALEGQGKFIEAAAEAEKAFLAMPTSLDCLRLYIHLMLRLERRTEARKKILGVIQSGLDTPDLRNALGEMCFYDNLFDESKDHFRRACEMGYASAYNNLGVVHFRLREYGEAKKAFERCLELEPNHRGAQRNLEKVLSLEHPETPPPTQG